MTAFYRALLAAAGLGLLVAVAVWPAAGHAVSALTYPDLVSDPPGPSKLEVYDDGSTGRLLVRFDGYIHNSGSGPLEVRGSDPADRRMTTVRQRVYRTDATFDDTTPVPSPQINFETNDDHFHWHLMHASRYSLWDDARAAEVGPASKVGFCMLDSGAVESAVTTPTYTGNCGHGDEDAASVVMGVSPGWRDYYGWYLALQWVDASDVVPGRYWMRSEIDPDGVITEANEANAPGWGDDATIIPGYVASGLDAGTVAGNIPTQLTLPATKWGGPGAARYEVVEAPQHGQLSQATGTWFSGSTLTYTPDPGYQGPDSFKYAARDGSSPFPLNPPSASATLAVGAPGQAAVVGISGAPGRMYAGTSVQLHATVTGGSSSNVQWEASAGSVSPAGLYSAPSSVPPGGSVRVEAKGVGASDAVTIGIDPAPAQRPAPTIAPSKARRGKNSLAPLRVRRHGRHLLATTRSTRAGKLVVRARHRGRRLATCIFRAPRGRTLTCRMRLPRRYRTYVSRGRAIVVRAVLRRKGHVLAVRRANVR